MAPTTCPIRAQLLCLDPGPHDSAYPITLCVCQPPSDPLHTSCCSHFCAFIFHVRLPSYAGMSLFLPLLHIQKSIHTCESLAWGLTFSRRIFHFSASIRKCSWRACPQGAHSLVFASNRSPLSSQLSALPLQLSVDAAVEWRHVWVRLAFTRSEGQDWLASWGPEKETGGERTNHHSAGLALSSQRHCCGGFPRLCQKTNTYNQECLFIGSHFSSGDTSCGNPSMLAVFFYIY